MKALLYRDGLPTANSTKYYLQTEQQSDGLNFVESVDIPDSRPEIFDELDKATQSFTGTEQDFRQRIQSIIDKL